MLKTPKKDDADTFTETPDLAAILGQAGAKRGKGSRWALRIGILAILAAGVAGYFYYREGESTYVYTTQEVRRGDLEVIVTATGSIQPTDQVDISSEMSGTVRNVNVTYNSTVKAGDVLAELDTNKLETDVQSARARLASARANVLKAEAELGSAKTRLDRLQSLVQSRVSSQQDLEAAQYAYDSAAATREINEASVLAAEADLRLAEVNLSKAKIISPIDGVILTRDVDPGATVAASLSAPILFTIAGDLRHMELQVAVDEADVGQVENGQLASFTVDAYPEMNFPAKITTVRYASETISNVVTYKAILSVDNETLLLRPGMTATADIIVKSIEDTILIPNAALRYTPPAASSRSRSSSLMRLIGPPRMGGRSQSSEAGSAAGRAVWVLRDNVPVRVAVETGSTDGQSTQLISGELSEGDRLITDATTRTR